MSLWDGNAETIRFERVREDTIIEDQTVIDQVIVIEETVAIEQGGGETSQAVDFEETK